MTSVPTTTTNSADRIQLKLISRAEKVWLRWNIEQFSSLVLKTGESIWSSVITVSDANWRLQLYPNGEIDCEPAGQISVYIWRISNGIYEHKVNFKIALVDVNNYGCCTFKGEEVFTNEDNIWGCDIISRAALLERKFRYLPNDNLTVSCRLTIKKVSHVNDDLIDQSEGKKCSSSIYSVVCLNNLSNNFGALFGNKEGCDVILKAEDKEFSAHTIVLRARSPVFAAMLTHNMQEKKNGMIDIPDISAGILENLLWFIYSGKVKEMSVEKAIGLFAAADKYAIAELKEECQYFLSINLSVDNVCDIAVPADIYNNEKLTGIIKHFLCSNISSVIATSRWNTLLDERPRLAAVLVQEAFIHFTKRRNE